MFAASTAERVLAYHQPHAGGTTGMAVLVQAMVDPIAAGWRSPPIPSPATATRWSSPPCPAWVIRWCPAKRSARVAITAGCPNVAPHARRRQGAAAGQAQAVATWPCKVADRYQKPQDIEWAIDQEGRLWLLQARPMTALPESVSWTAPGLGCGCATSGSASGYLKAVTPLFATWLLPELETGTSTDARNR